MIAPPRRAMLGNDGFTSSSTMRQVIPILAVRHARIIIPPSRGWDWVSGP